MHITLSDNERDFLRTQLSKYSKEHHPDSFDPQSDHGGGLNENWKKDADDWRWLDQFIHDLYMFDYRPGAPGWQNMEKKEV